MHSRCICRFHLTELVVYGYLGLDLFPSKSTSVYTVYIIQYTL